jgi:hypothetical protein
MSRAVTLEEVNAQLDAMEYIATNTKTGLNPSDRIILWNLENQRQRLTWRYRSRRIYSHA